MTTEQAESLTTILLIEDDMGVQMLAAQALRREGYHVLVAADMQEAKDVSEQYPSDIHVLLTDIMLPSGNGIELTRALLAKRPNLSVLYMSGFNTDAIQAVQNGAAPSGGFLEKPFTPRILVERVRALAAPSVPSAPSDQKAPSQEVEVPAQNSDAVYRLESAVRCPQCGETISTLKAVRLLRTQVNFTSTLPRRGRVLTCPCCLAIVPAELTNF